MVHTKLNPIFWFNLDINEKSLTMLNANISNVKVTFWDKMANNLEEAINQQQKKPLIIIISAGKVGIWNGNY